MAETTEQTPQAPSAEELKTAITEVTTAAALEDKNIPLEVKLRTGHIYKGATPRALIDELAKAQESATLKIRQQNEELERLKAAPVQQVQQPTAQDQYDAAEYYRLWQKDPREAEAYTRKFDPEYQALKQTFIQNEFRNEMDAFKGTVNWYPSDQQEAQAFTRSFLASGLQPNRYNYELVYRRMVDAGDLKASPIQEIRGQQPPPPRMGGSSAQPQDTGISVADFERLPSKQQAEVLERLKSQGYR